MLIDGAFWNNPMTLDDWEAPAAHRLSIDGPESTMSASEWLGLQHKRGFPTNPG